MKKLMILLIAFALAAAACGGDDGLSEGERAMVAAIVEGATSDPDPENPLSSDTEAATCFAEGLVEDMGVDRLAAIGFAADNEDPQAAFAAMSNEELDQVADIALDCIDMRAVIADQMVAEGMGRESAECFADEIEKTGLFETAFIAGMSGREFDVSENPEVAGAMLEAATACLSGEELGDVFGE